MKRPIFKYIYKSLAFSINIEWALMFGVMYIKYSWGEKVGIVSVGPFEFALDYYPE